jgi:hypothetical protein
VEQQRQDEHAPTHAQHREKHRAAGDSSFGRLIHTGNRPAIMLRRPFANKTFKKTIPRIRFRRRLLYDVRLGLT